VSRLATTSLTLVNPLQAHVGLVSRSCHIHPEAARGMLQARAFVTRVVQPGQLFKTHYATTNRLTYADRPVVWGRSVGALD
jgi:hypothetical protein